MSIVKQIYVTVKPDDAFEAERIWKNCCAPLMIQQPGCLSERLLRCIDTPGQYISYSEWDTQESIERYLESPAHEEIKKNTRQLSNGGPTVKRYELG